MRLVNLDFVNMCLHLTAITCDLIKSIFFFFKVYKMWLSVALSKQSPGNFLTEDSKCNVLLGESTTQQHKDKEHQESLI